MATKTIPTWDEFLSTAKEGHKSEWVDGAVVMMSPVSFYHELVLARLIACLVQYCQSLGDWLWVPSNAIFTMVPGNWRCSDASLVRRSRLPSGAAPPTQAGFAPDVAFEILSSTETPGQVQRHRQDYLESGVIQVWIDPEKRSIESVEPDQPLRYFQGAQPLVFSRLPGFQLIPEDLFKI